MGTFNYDSFAKLTRIFDLKKGQVVPPRPKARVILYSTTALKVQSRFADLNAFRPKAKAPFLTAALKQMTEPTPPAAPAALPVPVPEAPQEIVAAAAVAEEAPKPRMTLRLNKKVELASNVIELNARAEAPKERAEAPEEIVAAPAVAEEAPKPRTTLRLNKKVELPQVVSLSRRSTVQDLAAAFKAEMASTETKKPAGALSALSLPEEPFKRKRHPLSSKPWSELIAEAEAAMLEKKKKVDIDLAAAFKSEMKAFMAEQAKVGAAADLANKPVVNKPASSPRMALKLAA